MFTNALYYPSIDIYNEAWLKTAILFWDSIQTIVPESLTNPYENKASLELFNEGILKPYYVNSYMEEVKDLENDIYNYVNSVEGAVTLLESHIDSTSKCDYLELLLYLDHDMSKGPFQYIGFGKLPYNLIHKICDLDSYISKNGSAKVHQNFFNYYMTLLANSICNKNNLALLTDSVIIDNFSKKIQKNNLSDNDNHNIEYKICVMYKVIMDSVQIDPSTPMKKILSYKEKREDELNLFREEISNLIRISSPEINIKDFENKLSETYRNKIELAMQNIEKTLHDERIAFIKNHIASYIFGGIIPTLITSDLNFYKTIYLGASYGAAITMSAISYKNTMKISERKEPFSYLLKIRKKFMR